MKITIDISAKDFRDIKKMAKHCGSTPEVIARALIEGSPAQFLDSLSDGIWFDIIETVRSVQGNSPWLDRIERFLKASDSMVDSARSIEEVRLMTPHFKNLEAFEKLIGERD
jgi:hypothetical protein